VLGVDPGLGTHDRVRDVRVERRLVACPSRAKHVQAHAAHDRGQPGAQVVDVAGVGSAEPDPGLLHGVVRLGQGSEHPVGYGPQVGAVRLESLGQPFLIGHVIAVTCHIGRSWGVYREDTTS
jgi:hypothetical protein